MIVAHRSGANGWTFVHGSRHVHVPRASAVHCMTMHLIHDSPVVNVNKVATLRNSRGGRVPSVLDAVDVCVAAGAPGITVHPRADRRHITPDDVRGDRAAAARDARRGVEFNIEGDPRPDLLDLVDEVQAGSVHAGAGRARRGHQPGRLAARAGDRAAARRSSRGCSARGIRVSLFVDAAPDADSLGGVGRRRPRRAVHRAVRARVRARRPSAGAASFARYADAARLAHSLGLGVNAGHDLDLDNLVLFRELPHLDEVSIGHAIISRALFVGLATVVREYLDVLVAVRYDQLRLSAIEPSSRARSGRADS